MNSLVQIGQGRFTNSVAVRAQPAPASPAVLQMLAQSIATLNEKIDALAVRTSQPPARILVESREVAPAPLAIRPAQLPLAGSVRQSAADMETRDEPRINRRSLWDFFD